jgi:hypothetical protein
MIEREGVLYLGNETDANQRLAEVLVFNNLRADPPAVRSVSFVDDSSTDDEPWAVDHELGHAVVFVGYRGRR